MDCKMEEFTKDIFCLSYVKGSGKPCADHKAQCSLRFRAKSPEDQTFQLQ